MNTRFVVLADTHFQPTADRDYFWNNRMLTSRPTIVAMHVPLPDKFHSTEKE